MRKHHALSRAKKRNAPFLFFTAILLGFVLIIFAEDKTPFMSAEVQFADASPSGLQIMPASCNSVEHWQGECSLPTLCTLTVTPASYTSGTVSTVQIHWEAPRPSAANDSFIAGYSASITSIGTVFKSGTFNVAAPQTSTTYTFSGRYYNSSGGTLENFSCSQNVTVANAPTYALSVNQIELFTHQLDATYYADVSPGDRIAYRIFVSNAGDQSNIDIRARTPDYTTLVWQGGGTFCSNLGWDCHSTYAAGYFGEIWWQHESAPSGSELYVDFTVEVNANAPNGGEICHTGRAVSSQVASTNSNRVCNRIINCPTYLADEPLNPLGYILYAYDITGKRGDRNTTPICVANVSGNSYFIPAKTSTEIESFKTNLPYGATYRSTQ